MTESTITIKQLRERLGWTADKFGRECGLSGKNVSRTVYRWETDEVRPSLYSLIFIEKLIKKLYVLEKLY